MSRLIIDAQYQPNDADAAVPIKVVAGWDRPLQSFFLQFDLTDAQTKDPFFDPLLVCGAETAFAEYTDIDDVRGVFKDARVQLPDQAFDVLLDHQSKNMGNAIAQMDNLGNLNVLYQEPSPSPRP